MTPFKVRRQHQDRFISPFSLKETEEIIFHAGIYRCRLWVEPNHRYKVKVPPFQAKSTLEEISPFFTPSEVIVFVEKQTNLKTMEEFGDAESLNAMYFQSEEFFVSMQEILSRNIHRRFSASDWDSIMQVSANSYTASLHPFVQQNLDIRKKHLHSLARKLPNTVIADHYLINQPIQFQLPAYRSLFNLAFGSYLYGLSTQTKSAITDSLVNDSSGFNQLYTTLHNHYLLSDSLTELVLLKNIAEEYHRPFFNKKALLAHLDSLIMKENSIFPQYAQQTRQHLTHLMKGTAAPNFSGINSLNQSVSLNHYLGNYLYLGFCSVRSYECQRQFRVINTFHQKFGEHIKIVMLVTDPKDDVKRFIKENNYAWDILHLDGNYESINNYNIRAYPSYFLIDRDGRLLHSPAPLPTDQFEMQLFRLLREAGLM